MNTKPTVPEVLPLVKAYYKKSYNGVGGNFHIVLDDGNITDNDVLFCIEEAIKGNDNDGIEIGRLLLIMSKTQRKKLYYLSHIKDR